MEIDESKLWYCEQKGYPDEYLAWDKPEKKIDVSEFVSKGLEKNDKDLEKERPEGTS